MPQCLCIRLVSLSARITCKRVNNVGNIRTDIEVLNAHCCSMQSRELARLHRHLRIVCNFSFVLHVLHLVLTSFSTIHNAAMDVKLAWCLVCTRWLAVHALCNPDHISEELLHLRKTSCITDLVLLHKISSAFHSFHTAPRATAARRANALQLVVVWSKQSPSSVANMSSSSISLRYCKFMS